MSYTKTVNRGSHTVVSEDGEVLDSQPIQLQVLVKDNEAFCTSFAKHAGAILDLDGVQVKMLMWMSWNVTLNTNEIVLNRAIKERMMTSVGCSMKSVENSLTKLVKRKMVVRTNPGIYLLNPEMFWKGDIMSRSKNIKVFIEYTVQNAA